HGAGLSLARGVGPAARRTTVARRAALADVGARALLKSLGAAAKGLARPHAHHRLSLLRPARLLRRARDAARSVAVSRRRPAAPRLHARLVRLLGRKRFLSRLDNGGARARPPRLAAHRSRTQHAG